MKKITQLLIGSFFTFLSFQIQAQDRQLTQFYAAPLALNPALTGTFDGKYRVGVNYRDQWRSLLDQPYSTFALGADFKFNSFGRSGAFEKDKIGLGLLFLRDKVNILDFSTTQIALSTAYHKALDPNNKQYLSLGFQCGLNQRNVNYETLTFQDQWNGIDGYTFSTQEKLPANNFGYLDLNVGLNYSVTFAQKTALFLGGAFHHFNRPNVAFFKGEEFPEVKIDSRYSVQIAGQVPINRSNSVLLSPRLLATLQGPHLSANVGANVRTIIDKTYGTSLHLGSWLRGVRNNSSVDFDAVVLMAGLEYSGFLLGLSYDHNIPHVRSGYKRVQNVFELSLIYLGEFENSDDLLCPSF
jgi:type IX secretion system PorP/SprF family membrane protein